MIASGYTLNLYCDNEKAHLWLNDPSAFGEFSSDEKNCKAICFRMARKAGWKIKRGTCLCPNCVKEHSLDDNAESYKQGGLDTDVLSYRSDVINN